MATASSNDMKSFYRQKKTNKTGISKSRKKSPTKHAAAIGSNIAQPAALVTHGGALDLQEDYGKNETVLRQFDMNMAYGPCLGMTRVDRFERAQRLRLNPPKEIESLLKGGKVNSECLWDGRV
ncbi:uncharacterized protein LOC126672047 [Mercurialis annua]|uniref:uncharacterized protein LOC126672047 n=1 Tax=Mercurialis annua TaxID=3986 RepID=UPI00215ED384|nr:uncharacterized protein LOC126672047 [Mercurialis annua]